MEYRHVGTSGLVVSAVGLGCGAFGRSASEGQKKLISAQRSEETIRAALDAGITLFDTSDSYGDCEEILARVLGENRDNVIIATKFGNSVKGALGNDHGARGARGYVRRAVERSLRRLRTDRIDLYQMHSPDPSTPIEETLAVLTDLVREGKVRYLGASKFTAWQIVDADWTARVRGLERFVAMQSHYSLLARGIENDVVPVCEHLGVGLITLRPLANGLLTGKYRRSEPHPDVVRPSKDLAEASYATVETLEGFAAQRGVSLLDVSLGGLIAQPGVASVIAGATSAEQVRANAAAGAWKPSAEDRAILDELTAAGPWPQDAAGSWPNIGDKWIGRPPVFSR